ncbi:MarR family transcriptional regulator, 2-MHQ and catechol-resistance regulon repressor [Fontibacillus panacisegetis]|uniref:MarR family transcriptional regulator, 2-MHQ and catechol-resistance regulon repressor n=1 Tax=Fontibacillus panacisegetis TaxID=670482 RepID=A0A1G7MCI8_9BACL|nr:MarR family transcriptional regulator [Fontibacillus panacisegetis]SDF59518.1 MarR family transcriptional regulator, 2-MHQ and catechol-resistance regulon repressor [Fontibacillus panacisegetis]
MEHGKEESLDLFVALSRASQWVNAYSDRNIKSHDLTRTEFGVLDLLYHKGPQPIQQICGKVLMSSGNITYVLDKLEKKLYVRRRDCTEDRRLIYAEITDQGKQFFEEIFPKHAEVIDAALGGLDEEEKRVAARLLKKMGKYAQAGYK